MGDTVTTSMEASSALNSYSSQIIEIVAGTKQKSLFAHAAILSKSDKRIKLPDWDAETVARMVDWLYTGEYPCQMKAEPVIAAQESGWDSPDTANIKQPSKDTLIPVGELRSGLPRLSKRTESHGVFSFGIPRSWANKDRLDRWMMNNLKHEEPLFALGRLYTLASYMLLPELQSDFFDGIQFYLKAIGDLSRRQDTDQLKNVKFTVIDLAEYVYANTITIESTEEPLCNLISTFIALEFSHFGGLGMENLRDFDDVLAGDVLRKLKRHVWQLEEHVRTCTLDIWGQ